jgi:hypothetical protein
MRRSGFVCVRVKPSSTLFQTEIVAPLQNPSWREVHESTGLHFGLCTCRFARELTEIHCVLIELHSLST